MHCDIVLLMQTIENIQYNSLLYHANNFSARQIIPDFPLIKTLPEVGAVTFVSLAN
jgi:hypothetical protein